jgi:hypothetical protein
LNDGTRGHHRYPLTQAEQFTVVLGGVPRHPNERSAEAIPLSYVNSESSRSDATREASSYDPIAPTEFPTGWSATRRVEPRRPSSSVTYSPQEEDTVHPSHPKTAIGLGLPPNVLELGLTIGQ